MKELQKKNEAPRSKLQSILAKTNKKSVHPLFRHVLGFRQITPICLPTFSKAAKTLSNCSSVWVAM